MIVMTDLFEKIIYIKSNDNKYPCPYYGADGRPMHKKADWDEHLINVDAVLHLLKDGSVVWAAWGDLINSRKWCIDCRDTILYNIQKNKKNICWVKMGNLTKSGNPRHPLYLKCQPFSEYTVDREKKK
jgi:hypothetical protein